MSTTDRLDEALATVKAQEMQTRLEEVDGVTVMVVDDGETRMDISDEMGSKSRAARALRQLAATALARAEMLDGEGSRNPLLKSAPKVQPHWT